MPDATPIFFWSDIRIDGLPVPGEHVRTDIDPTRAAKLVAILKSGSEICGYRGMAECRMPGCQCLIGSKDLGAHGFIWPQGCEHYVTHHSVWPPGADELIAASEKA